MTDFYSLKHKIQIYIFDYLSRVESARFRDLRPPRTETNLFTYHLQVLRTAGLVRKVADGYALSPAGLALLVARRRLQAASQPDVAVMLLVQNSDGDVLLEQRTEQPFIGTWSLPHCAVSVDDASLAASAERLSKQALGLSGQSLTHAGDCYVRVVSEGQPLATTLVHLYSFNTDTVQTSENLQWARPHKLHQLTLSPATAEIIARGFFRDPYFFEEFTVEWL